MRIVAFSVVPLAYDVVSAWAAECGHEIALLVTTPGPASRRNTSYQRVINSAASGTDILVTTRLRKVALPLIQALEPDLIVSYTFPYRIPPEIIAVARHGAVNMHPTALPAYRGPNPLRGIYEGNPLLGATLHWTAAEYDTGNILAQHTGPLPAVISPASILAAWLPMISGALAEGVTRAIAGDAGSPQDESRSSYAARFTDEEHWITPFETMHSFLCKCAAINFFSPSMKLELGGTTYVFGSVEILDDSATCAPGTISDQTQDSFVLQVRDGRLVVKVPHNPMFAV